MNYKYLLILLVVLVAFGCTSNPLVDSTEESAVQMRISRETMPEGITAIIGVIERDDYETQIIDFDMTTDPIIGIFPSVHVGNWHLSVSAYAGDVLSYFGETDIMINPGENNVTLTLNPENGNLIVEIEWNTPEDEHNYIIAYSYNSTNKNIYKYDVENETLSQLTDNNSSTHPFYNEAEDKIYYVMSDHTSIYRMDFDGSNNEYIASFSHNSIFPLYCEANDMYYYYYINSYGTKVVVIENPVTGEILNFPAGEFDRYRPVPNVQGDKVLYQATINGLTSIRLYDFNTTSDIAVTATDYQTAMPKWDAEQTGFYYRENLNRLLHKNIETGEITEIIPPINCESFYFDVSEDGDYISLNIDYGSGKDLYYYSIETSTLTQVTESGIFWGFPYWVKK